MKDYVLELVSKKEGYNAKLNTLREYLQAYALRVLHEEGVFRYAAFLGGTALRFLYNLPRFSEDIDFSLAKKEKEFSFINSVKKVKEEFLLAGYNVSASYNEEKTVQNAFLKFEGLMFEVGLSPFKKQNLSIKVEIDINPPEGADTQTAIVNKYFPISFLSYDINSLFTGKLHALLSRRYTKGRDLFDLGWYLSKWKGLTPNFVLLKNGLIQTGWSKEIPAEGNWRKILYDTVKKVDWEKVKKDVESFLENPSDMDIFSKENVLNLISASNAGFKR